MPAPTGVDGMRRAMRVFLGVSISVLLLVAFAREFIGGGFAGVLYLVLAVGIPFALIYKATTHWNTVYTAGFLLYGVFLLAVAPSVTAQLVPPHFRVIGAAIGVLFIVGMLGVLATKLQNSSGR